MAFATSNVKQSAFGTFNSLVGDWTGSAGDASGTISVGGARVYLCIVSNQDAVSQEDRPTPCDISTNTTTGISTITVHNHADVTQGRFFIVYR